MYFAPNLKTWLRTRDQAKQLDFLQILCVFTLAAEALPPP